MTVRNASAPILMANTLWDPATGYDGMLNVHSQIEGSVLLALRRGSWQHQLSNHTRGSVCISG
jgi:TAP-like protein